MCGHLYFMFKFMRSYSNVAYKLVILNLYATLQLHIVASMIMRFFPALPMSCFIPFLLLLFILEIIEAPAMDIYVNIRIDLVFNSANHPTQQYALKQSLPLKPTQYTASYTTCTKCVHTLQLIGTHCR